MPQGLGRLALGGKALGGKALGGKAFYYRLVQFEANYSAIVYCAVRSSVSVCRNTGVLLPVAPSHEKFCYQDCVG
jgi:hypothetical protein